MTQKIIKCGYARVSTLAEEQENSLVAQISYYKQFIESDPAAIFAGIFADKKSGKNSRARPQFNEMVKAVRRGEIGYIITKSIARFARNLVETLRYVREFREMGVGIYFEKENIDTLSSTSDFTLSVYATFAESELYSMGEQVKWAARRRFANGSVELGIIYGYDIVNGQLVVNPDEAAIIKEIFERYASGEGQDKITRRLNERGIKRKISDGLWGGNTIRRMLENEKYTGDALLQKSYTENFKSVINHGEVPQYLVENNHEAIISHELFNIVQELLVKRRKVAKDPKALLSPFSTKIRCGECGKGYKRRRNNNNTPYEKFGWSCQTYVHNGRKFCSGQSIREKDFLRVFLSAYNEAVRFEPEGTQRDMGECIKDLLTQERGLIALKAKGYIQRADFEEQHAELVAQIRELEATYAIESRRQGYIKQKPAEEYSDKLAAHLEKATINGFTITFYFKNGAKIQKIFNNDTDRKATWANKAAIAAGGNI